MPKSLRVTFAESALKDLENILEYYIEQQVPHVGNKLVGNVNNKNRTMIRIRIIPPMKDIFSSCGFKFAT